MKRILVTGAGGFIGDHLVRRLKAAGHRVRGVGLKRPEFRRTLADQFVIADLRRQDAPWSSLMAGIEEVYAFAANMGGMGFISFHHAEILEGNLLININTARAARQFKAGRLLFSSSACVYPQSLQATTAAIGLRESDAYPADPENAYGWEKLTVEKLLTYWHEESALDVRIARFHNIFGPYGTWRGGREKAPAAFCRKIAEAKLVGSSEIEMWGDGEQTRSFCYVDDCVTALEALMASAYHGPVNVGQDRAVTMNWLASLISEIAGWPIEVRHVAGPEGVRGRNSDNTLAEQVLAGWRPTVGLERGLEETYAWIEQQVKGRLARCA